MGLKVMLLEGPEELLPVFGWLTLVFMLVTVSHT